MKLLFDDKDVLYTVTGVNTLSKAREVVDSSELGAVIIDLNVPDSQGIETVKSLIEYCSDKPIIVITCDNSLENAKAPLRLGVQDYIIKENFNTEVLSQSIKSLILRCNKMGAYQDQQKGNIDDENANFTHTMI